MTSTSFSAHRQLAAKHSATDLVSSGSFASPLAQLSLSGSSFAGPSRLRDEPSPPPVPPLSLNLFRTPSVYSVDSISSLSTISNDERAFNIEGDESASPESPSTPRASNFQQVDYFSANAAPSAPLTPKRGFAVTSRPQPSPGRQHIPYKTASTSAVHLTENNVEAQQPEQAIVSDDLESLHGEQGSDWGEDEANFEWVDNDHGPVAANGDGKHISPSKRLGKTLKSAVSIGGGEGKRLRKNLVFPRRAAPPPPPDTAPSPAPPSFSPRITDAPLSPRPGDVVFPTPGMSHRPGLSQRWTDGSAAPTDLFNGPAKPTRPLPSPLMMPMRAEDGPSSRVMAATGTRNSHMSMQSAAYSFYDIDSPGATTPRSSTPTSRTPTVPQDHIFPNGRYAKVSVSRLEKEREARERGASDPPRRDNPDVDFTSPEVLVAKGIEARGLGDLAKSAWFFMKAAEKGSSTGRMYWGLALRHGWGVAKDSKRAFAELRQACDESLAEGGIDFHQSPGAIKLTLHQRRALTRDLSLGMFEIANCFLEGVGGKKSPDVALSYLRFAGNLGDIAAQEQLGFLLSKGGSGIKKDMKEAAKWYRMAIGQGSTNTFGLAWVWKDKYMR